MYILIQGFMNNLTKEQVNQFALQNNTDLSPQELDFTYHFVKKNWKSVLQNPNSLELEKYRNQFSEENFNKIQNLMIMYFNKYKHFL